jgi:hypothetical protein
VAVKKVNSDAADTENTRRTMMTMEMLPHFFFEENNNWFFISQGNYRVCLRKALMLILLGSFQNLSEIIP